MPAEADYRHLIGEVVSRDTGVDERANKLHPGKSEGRYLEGTDPGTANGSDPGYWNSPVAKLKEADKLAHDIRALHS